MNDELKDEQTPALFGRNIPVPEDLVNAGKSTSLPRSNDSPESLDAVLNAGMNTHHGNLPPLADIDEENDHLAP